MTSETLINRRARCNLVPSASFKTRVKDAEEDVGVGQTLREKRSDDA